jgi:hypothetical protein
MARRFCSNWAVLLLLPAWFDHHASAQTGKLGEYEIKAAFLYHFANYTEWPEEAFADKNAPFTFGIFGENPFSDILNGFTNKFVRERPVRIMKCSSWDEARDCHLLFIGSSEKNKLTEILAHLKTRSILTVADTDSFLESGGIIHLITANNRVGFEINVDAAKEAKLKISSQVLSLAKRVKGQRFER